MIKLLAVYGKEPSIADTRCLDRLLNHVGIPPATVPRVIVDDVRPGAEKRFLLALDAKALKELTQRDSTNDWRGSIVRCARTDDWVFCSLPPSNCLPPLCIWEDRWLLEHDFRRFADILRRGSYQEPTYDIRVAPTYLEVIRWLDEAASLSRHSFDIEVASREITCLSIAFTPAGSLPKSMSIPFVYTNILGQQLSYFSPAEELEIWLRLELLLCSPKKESVGQNAVFDTHFLFDKLGFLAQNVHDTMIAQNIIMPDYPKGLDFITSLWTDLPYYKKDGKQWLGFNSSQKNFWAYNAIDALVCELAFPKQLKQLQEDGNLEAYDRQRKIIPSLVYMSARGINADIRGLQKARTVIDAKVTELVTELPMVDGAPLKYRSPKELKRYFYDIQKYHQYVNRKTRKPTVDASALTRLASTHGDTTASTLLEIRKLEKIFSTYLRQDKLSTDGRMRSAYNPAGTRLSRISSSETIYDEGGNLQNWPHSVQRQVLRVDPGCVGYAIDLSNAELRIAAYYTPIASFIDCYLNGIDVHAQTGSQLFGGTWQDILAADKAKITVPLGNGTKTARSWSKICNFGLLYDMSLPTFALNCELSQAVARPLYDAYHKAVPEVRQVFHKRIREELLETGFVTNLLNRRVRFQGKPDANTFRAAYASVPQSTVGDIINERGLHFVTSMPEVDLLNQVHDELVIQLPLSLGWDQHSRILGDITASLETPLHADDRTFVIPADVTMFRRFKAGKETRIDPAALEKSWNILKEVPDGQ